MVGGSKSPVARVLAVILGLGIGGAALPALGGSPDAIWKAPWVQVSGGNADLNSAINSGLRGANQVYFYGDRATKMVAKVRGDVVDVRILDARTGQVLASRKGLAFDGSGRSAAKSIRSAALSWMAGLDCGAGCAVASGAKTQPKQVAKVAPKRNTTAERKRTESAAAKAKAERAAVKKAEADARKIAARQAKADAEARAAEARAAEARAAEERRANAARLAALEAEKKAVDSVNATKTPDVAKAPVSAGGDAPRTSTVSDAAPNVGAPRLADPVKTTTPEGPVAPTTGDTGVATGAADTLPKATARSAASEPNTGSADVAAAPSLDRAPIGGTGDTVPATPEAVDRTPTVADRVVAAPEATTGVGLKEPTAGSLTPATGPKVGDAAPTTGAADDTPTSVTLAPTDTPSAGAIDETKTLAVDTERAGLDIVPGVSLPVPRPGNGSVAVPLGGADAAADTAEAATATAENETKLAVADSTRETVPVAPDDTADAKLAAELAANLKKETDGGAKTGTGADAADSTDNAEDTRVAAVAPTGEGPTLANARWIGFTPAVYKGEEGEAGAWISGPFDRKGRTGWITDTATGATTRVKFIWRDGGADGRTAILSKAAAKALGLGQGDVANVAVYLPR